MEYDFFSFDEIGCDVPKTFVLPNGKTGLLINAETITKAVALSFERLSFSFTKKHIEHLIDATLSDDASDNDRYVCATLLKNAKVAAEGKLPICQDTGIANVFAFKDNGVFVDGDENSAIAKSVAKTYIEKKLRLSTTVPDSIFAEHDPKNNLPANIMIFSSEVQSDFPEYKILCSAKGGGSSNKTTFIQATKALLNEKDFDALLREKITSLGTSACPPYTIAVVAGGLSPEQNLIALKLATSGAFDSDENLSRLKNVASLTENIVRDAEWENRVMEIAATTKLGAQFGGTKMALSAIVLRLPRHGASCPISVGVSCSAHRNVECKITKDGIYIEKTVYNLEQVENFSKAVSFAENKKSNSQIALNTNDGIFECLKKLSALKTGERILLNGKILVARDAAHARWKSLVDNGKPLPDYCAKYPILYAGPAQTPEGFAIGSFGPTTAGRMDSYADLLMSQNASLITIAKGNRSKAFIAACKKYGAFYLGTIGGAAALIASEYIKSVSILDYEDLGMEAVRLIEVENLPAFLLTDNKGNDFYSSAF